MLTRRGFIEFHLRMLYGPREADERTAFHMLGGMRYSARRKARRLRLLAIAQDIAKKEGHGDAVEMHRIIPDTLTVPVGLTEEVAVLLRGR